MLKVGLTGGLASGKSFVAEHFARWGARVLYADRVGHETLEPDGEAYAEVVAEFGDSILRPDGTIDRKALGAIVFADPDKLERLSALVHPHVLARQRAFFRQVREDDPQGVAVVEAAIMIETGSYKAYDRLVVAACPVAVQIQRFVERGGGGEADARARLARQIPLAEKVELADYVIDTSGSTDDTISRAAEVWEKLKIEASIRRS
ncbi:MAG: dephospho-CoA kinase [Bryobacterales bacterium]|nr:dephospho-CoA kinase [Acidobacteriota bacterium]MCB9384968.1 dephospho-CoA kinase [Bryobacterales bacterium]